MLGRSGIPKPCSNVSTIQSLGLWRYPQSSHDSRSGSVCVIEKSIHVRQQRVPNLHSPLGRFSNGRPDISLLRVGGERVVVAVKWEESRDLHPAVAQLFITVSIETVPRVSYLKKSRTGERHTRKYPHQTLEYQRGRNSVLG